MYVDHCVAHISVYQHTWAQRAVLQHESLDCLNTLRQWLLLLQTRQEKKHLAQFGLDLINGEVRNNVQAGVLEPTLAKTKIIQVTLIMTAVTIRQYGLNLYRHLGHLPLLPHKPCSFMKS